MQKSKSSKGFSLPPNIPRGRQRQQRTVYSVEQREELERFFQNNHYPSYDERETLAARLNLEEHQVQVWFKNHRAKYRKSRELTQEQGRAARASTQSLRVGAPAPAPAPEPAPEPAPVPAPAAADAGLPDDLIFAFDPVFSGDAAAPGGAGFQGGPGFYSSLPPDPLGGAPAAQSSAPSHMQAWWDPAQEAQNLVPAAAAASAPAAAPVWPEGSNASSFGPDLFESPSFAELLTSQDPLEGPSSLQSRHQGEESGAEDDSGPKMFMNL